MNSSRKLGFLIGTIVIFVALILIGPMDFFTHGAYGDPINISNLTEEDYLGTVPLSQEEEYSIYFTPQQNYFTGFWIYPDLQSSSGDGFICIKTYLQSGTQMEQIQIPVSDISSSGYYYVETSARYLAGETYKVAFSVKDTLNAPSFYLVSSAYIPVESTQSNLLIGYLYAAPVFSLAEKAIIFLVLLSIWFFLLATLWFGENTKARSHQARIVSAFLAIVSVFTMNYMFAVFYSDDTAATFSSSDTLVLSVLDAPAHHLQQNAFGLGDLTSGRGTYFSNGRDANYPNDSNWAYGYSKTKPIIALSKNSYTEQFAREGTTVLFANGTSHTVNEVVDNGSYYMMVLSATAPLSYEEYGSLDLATYYTADGTEFQAYFLSPYKAQFGLQGKIFFLLSTLLPQGDMETAFNLLCSGAMAGVLSVLIFLIRHRYGLMMAVCFGGTFLLSPWIGAAASSLYWVSFTWFLPMIIGLICAIWIENKAVCIGMIALGYASILIKSLCGYEYITTVMLGLISFLLVDFLLALIRRDRVHSVLLFRTIFLMGFLRCSAS